MGFKKYDGSTWQPITPKKLKGIPYTGTLPATLTGTKAGYLHKYKIFGNTEQTGTPTPENPIVPSECGERTENLFNYGENLLSCGSYGQTVIKKNNGLYVDRYVSASAGGIIFNFEYNTQYTLSFKRDGNANVIIYMFDSDIQGDTFPTNQYNYISIPYNTSQYTFSIADFNVKTVIIGVSGGSTQVNTGVYDIMVCIGETPPTKYIPYGYKLPLTSGSTPVDIYLGGSQATRRIKKLVLTGNETSWKLVSNYYYALIASNVMLWHACICTHCGHQGVIGGNTNNELWIRRAYFPDYQTLEDFKTYLQQQYTNGTPVTVWYVLANEETGTLNEPLRKIGGYADTIDSTQTTAQIPTAANSTTISWAGEGLAPSEFDSIQEWVDIATYTYTNGEWVADN